MSQITLDWACASKRSIGQAMRHSKKRASPEQHRTAKLLESQEALASQPPPQRYPLPPPHLRVQKQPPVQYITPTWTVEGRIHTAYAHHWYETPQFHSWDPTREPEPTNRPRYDVSNLHQRGSRCMSARATQEMFQLYHEEAERQWFNDIYWVEADDIWNTEVELLSNRYDINERID